MIRGDVDWALLAIGLDVEEARLYRSLVSRGPSTVGSLAPEAGISRTKAYSVLDRMVAKGIANRTSDHPRTYCAVNPERLLRRRQEDFGSASETIRLQLLPLFQERDARSRHLSLRGSAVFRRAEDMLSRAKRDIVIVATFVPQEFSSRLATLIGEVHERGVRVRTVVGEALAESDMLGRLRGLADVKVRKVPNAGMLIVDDEEVLIGSFSAPEELTDEGRPGDYTMLQGLWSRDLELIKLQRMLFEDLYRKGVA
jgi:sugar-specific transcriptional regulator TrmB